MRFNLFTWLKCNQGGFPQLSDMTFVVRTGQRHAEATCKAYAVAETLQYSFEKISIRHFSFNQKSILQKLFGTKHKGFKTV